MAVCNSTQSLDITARQAFGFAVENSFQPEKISSSIPDFPSVDPTVLLGRLCHFADMQTFPLAGKRFYDALVTSVSLGCESLGTSSHLLLRLNGTDDEEFVPVSELQLLSFNG